MKWLDLIYTAAADSFIQVGTFVAISLLLFGYANYRTQGNLIKQFTKHKKLQVFIGAILGLTPGCGGAILVMPLYLKGQVTFGTVVATLVATMGDAAFVLLVSMPKDYLIVSILSFIPALITGYLIDYFKIGNHIIQPESEEVLEEKSSIFRPEQTEFSDIILEKGSCCKNSNTIAIDCTTIPNINKILYSFRHNIGYIIFWILAILALPLGILNLMQIDFNTVYPIKNLGIIGFIGTLFSIFYNLICKHFIADDALPEAKSKQNSLKETLIHNAEETAFVIMWVFLALLIYSVIVELIGGEAVIAHLIKQTGYLVVIAALFVGFIPGCGPQILLAALYVQGLIPLSALVANAICNDGDALFPIIAMNKKAAFWVTVYSTIPAIIVGSILFFMGY